MKKFFLFFLLPFIFYSCGNVQGDSPDNSAVEKENVKNGIFIHLSHGSEDPQRVLMALKMADIMSEDKDVLVYFDVKAVYVVLKDSENISLKEGMPTSHEMLEKLINKGVELEVCPGCLEVAGKTMEDVMDGVKMADKEKFFNFTSGKILTIDY